MNVTSDCAVGRRLHQILGNGSAAGAESLHELWQEAPVAEWLPLLYEAVALTAPNQGTGGRI